MEHNYDFRGKSNEHKFNQSIDWEFWCGGKVRATELKTRP